MDSKTILRRNYQKKFDALKKVMIEIPPQGWLKTIRDFLGMTSSQLAKRIGVSQPRVFAMEKNEKNIIPPTIEMVERYCLEHNLPINPQKFMDYYDSNGWKVGKSKMRDWQATVRSWARREAENSPSQPVQEVKKYKF